MSTTIQTTQERPVGGPPVLAGRVLFGLGALALFAATVWWRALGEFWGPGVSAALAYLAVGLHIFLSIRRLSPFDPLVWVPIALLLFYFGAPVVIEVLGQLPAGGYDPWAGNNAGNLDRGYAIALFSTVALLFGIYLAGVRPMRSDPNEDAVRDLSLGATALLFTVGSLIMMTAGIGIVGPSRVFGLYHEWWDAKALGADQRWIDTGLVFSMAGIFSLLAVDDPKVRWRRRLAFFLVPLIALVAIQKGDRTTLIALAVGAGWCFTQRIRPVSWPPVLIAGFIALAVMPVIGEWRSQRSLEDSKRSSVDELFGASLSNMGSSVNAIIFTTAFVPNEQPYALGRTFWAAALQAIPNPGLTKGKEFAKGRFEDNPSIWLTWRIAPEWAATGGGYGFAMAAEWYYNFGLPGVLFGMALVGWGLARARNRARRSSLALVWSATLFAGIAIWVRNIVGYPVHVAVWPIVGIWAIQRVVLMLRARGRSAPSLARATSEPLTP